MKYLYSIWDSKAEEFCPPFVAKNDKMASRMYLQSIKNVPYSEDMTLYKIGQFESENPGVPVCGFTAEAVPIEVSE